MGIEVKTKGGRKYGYGRRESETKGYKELMERISNAMYEPCKSQEDWELELFNACTDRRKQQAARAEQRSRERQERKRQITLRRVVLRILTGLVVMVFSAVGLKLSTVGVWWSGIPFIALAALLQCSLI